MKETSNLNCVEKFKNTSNLELAQELSRRLAISHRDWHRLQGDRQAQAGQQLSAALIFLLKEQPELALSHLQQATGWLDKSLKAPGCPDKKSRK